MANDAIVSAADGTGNKSRPAKKEKPAPEPIQKGAEYRAELIPFSRLAETLKAWSAEGWICHEHFVGIGNVNASGVIDPNAKPEPLFVIVAFLWN